MSGPGGRTGSTTPLARELVDRAQAPLRWPHPDRLTVTLVVTWAVGLVVALLVPAMIVGPGERNAPAAEVWTAFGITVLGAVVMLGAAAALYRHARDWAVMVWGMIPAFSVIVGGVILTTVKLTATTQGL